MTLYTAHRVTTYSRVVAVMMSYMGMRMMRLILSMSLLFMAMINCGAKRVMILFMGMRVTTH